CGTPEYMSPEQARGEDVDGRSDLYAVGVILYQLVTGELPFTASSPVGILSKHLAEPPVPPSLKRPGLAIPPALERVILHALAKDPGDRPRTAEHLRRALRLALSDIPDLATTPGTGHRALGSSDSLSARPTTPIGLPAPTTAPTSNEHPLKAPVVHASARRRPRLVPAVALLGLVGTAAWFIVAGPNAGRTPSLVTNLTRSPSSSPVTSAGAVTANPAIALTRPEPVPAPPPPEAAAPTTEPAAAPPIVAPAAREKRNRAPGGTGRTTKPALKVSDALTAAVGATALTTAPPAGEPGSPESGASAQDGIALAPVAPPALAKPAARAGSLDAMKEAERLLGQGDVVAACEKGEEQRNATPALAQVYKFLGKCFMRAGKPDKAMSNYRRYLELAPEAPDAAFIRSIVR
ncbi:MAG TPA: hypothetical protein VGG33_10545, partial [Polyangia bacterium]